MPTRETRISDTSSLQRVIPRRGEDLFLSNLTEFRRESLKIRYERHLIYNFQRLHVYQNFSPFRESKIWIIFKFLPGKDFPLSSKRYWRDRKNESRSGRSEESGGMFGWWGVVGIEGEDGARARVEREEGSWRRSGRGLIRKISLRERQAHLTEARSPRKGAPTPCALSSAREWQLINAASRRVRRVPPTLQHELASRPVTTTVRTPERTVWFYDDDFLLKRRGQIRTTDFNGLVVSYE